MTSVFRSCVSQASEPYMRRSIFCGRAISNVDEILDMSNVQIYLNLGYTIIQLSL